MSMQIVSNGDILHELSKMFSGENTEKYFNMSTVENFTQSATLSIKKYLMIVLV